MMRTENLLRLLVSIALVLGASASEADTGKLALTGGVTSIDGAAGGGISPWALIGTNATQGQSGVSVSVASSPLQDYALTAVGIAVAYDNRAEFSLSQQSFDASVATRLNTLGFKVNGGQQILMSTAAVKFRLAGEAILDSDTWMPQISAGLMVKQTDAGSIRPVFDYLGASSSGVEGYLSASKLLLARGLLFNATLRYTQANQGGLLGFGSKAAGGNDYQWAPEVSAAWLLSRRLAIGAEWRYNPSNLAAVGQAAGLGMGLASDNWMDLFVAWAPTAHLSFTLAYVDLGRILPAITSNKNQTGMYLAGQVSF